MPITLPTRLEKDIQKKVSSGEYASPEDVIDAGLRLLNERDAELADPAFKDRLGRSIERGLRQVEQGQTAPFDEAYKKELRSLV